MKKRTLFIGVGAALIGLAVVVGLIAASDKKDKELTEEELSQQVVEIEQPTTSGEVTDSATYKITLNSTWSEESHGDSFPAGAHLSPMVVATHANGGELFSTGTEASPGFEIVAETGATAEFTAELNSVDSINSIAVGKRIDVPAKDEVTITASQAENLLSVVSMLAPSPDWVVGVNNVPLFRDGGWIDSITLSLTAFDAGTDDGATYTAGDKDTSPKGTIQIPDSGQLADVDGTIGYGTVEITRVN